MRHSFVSKGRFYFIVVCVVFAFAATVGRLCYLHIWAQEKYQRIVERSRHNFQKVNARRGNILDCNGVVLATTRAMVELGVDPQMTDEETEDLLWMQLGKMAKVEWTLAKKKAFQKIIEQQGPDGKEIIKPRWRKLSDRVADDKYAEILDLGIPGIYGNRKYERVYPSGKLAAHVLGFLNKEERAVTAVEYYMDFYLRGQSGWVESERDGRRREMMQFRSREIEPVDGYHVQLTLDSVVQNIIEAELKRIVDDYIPEWASIIVSDPITGQILGLANTPTYNPNVFWKFDMDSYRNRALTDIFEPGSSFKLVTATGVLEHNLVNVDDIFDCTLTHANYRGRRVPLPKDYKPMDKLSMGDIVKQSSNRGVAQLAMILGEEGLYEYARAFGFGEKTGYGPSGEVRGIVHPPSEWDGLTIGRMPMGHAVASTAMQVHNAMGVYATGGVLMEPQVIKAVLDDNDNVVVEFPAKIKRKIINRATARTITELITSTSPASRSRIPGYSVAGKSGTTQKIINGKYSTRYHVSSFSGFLPASRPRVLITVVIDKPIFAGIGYGNVVAAPAFKNVAEQLIQYLDIPSDSEYSQLREQENHFKFSDNDYTQYDI